MKLSTQQLISTLLWSSTDDDGEPLDRVDAQPSPELIARLEADWEQFEPAAMAILQDDPDDAWLGTCSDPDWDADSQLAHDFILTRNGHGAGFWDGDWEHGDELTALAQRFAEIEPYVGDDGLIYLFG